MRVIMMGVNIAMIKIKVLKKRVKVITMRLKAKMKINVTMIRAVNIYLFTRLTDQW